MAEGEGRGVVGVTGRRRSPVVTVAVAGKTQSRPRTEAGHIEGVGDCAAVPAGLCTIIRRFCECRVGATLRHLTHDRQTR
jgi:hypothetical protein